MLYLIMSIIEKIVISRPTLKVPRISSVKIKLKRDILKKIQSKRFTLGWLKFNQRSIILTIDKIEDCHNLVYLHTLQHQILTNITNEYSGGSSGTVALRAGRRDAATTPPFPRDAAPDVGSSQPYVYYIL